MKRKKKETIFLLIEINEVFCKELKRKFKNEQNVIVVHGSAENIKKYMEEFHIEYVDYVLSGLPFYLFTRRSFKAYFKQCNGSDT